jgi:hypothetical protein
MLRENLENTETVLCKARGDDSVNGVDSMREI